MDENEILSRIDARGRAAAAGVHDALADTGVPLFDPEVHTVTLDGGAPRRWTRLRWMSAAGILVLALVATVTVLAVDPDGGDDPADQLGTGAPPRPFAAGHLPDGFAVAGVSDTSTASDWEGVSGPLVLFGPDVSHPEMAIAVVRAGDETPEDDSEGEVVTLGDRRLALISSPGFAGHAGTVEVDGRQLIVMGRDRPALEAIAATVEVGEGDRPVVDPSTLPAGWEELGQLANIESAYGGPVVSLRGGSAGSWLATYMGGGDEMLMVTSAAGGPLDVAAGRLLARSSEDVEVRGHPAVLTRMGIEEVAGPGDDRTIEMWSVSWEERPGEVVRVGGYGVGRDDVLAVAEGVRPVESVEWAALGREGLRVSVASSEGAVELGEGTFSDGSPWLAYVEVDGFESERDGQGDAGSAGGPISSGGEPAVPDPRMTVRTAASFSTSMSSGSTGAGAGSDPFLDSISVEGGEALAWVYGLLRAEVATVELVGTDGEVLATAEVLRAEGYQGFLLELPPGLAISGLEGPSSSGPATSVPADETATSGVETATTVAHDPSMEEPGPMLVARAADGTELGRQGLP